MGQRLPRLREIQTHFMRDCITIMIIKLGIAAYHEAAAVGGDDPVEVEEQ
jgi:hypothetical protein